MTKLRGYVWFVRRYGLVQLIRYGRDRRNGLTIDYGRIFTDDELARLEEHILVPPWKP